MLSMFSGLDLTQDPDGIAVSNCKNGRSAAKDLLAAKSTAKQAETEFAALQAWKKQQRQQNRKKEQSITALSQALSLFDKEMDERDSFVSRNTKRRQKNGKKMRGGATVSSRCRNQRQAKYKHV